MSESNSHAEGDAVAEGIRVYANTEAGTPADLDEDLERSATEFLLAEEKG